MATEGIAVDLTGPGNLKNSPDGTTAAAIAAVSAGIDISSAFKCPLGAHEHSVLFGSVRALGPTLLSPRLIIPAMTMLANTIRWIYLYQAPIQAAETKFINYIIGYPQITVAPRPVVGTSVNFELHFYVARYPSSQLNWIGGHQWTKLGGNEVVYRVRELPTWAPTTLFQGDQFGMALYTPVGGTTIFQDSAAVDIR